MEAIQQLHNLKKEQKKFACADKTLFSHWLDSNLRPIISAEANGDAKMREKMFS